MGLIYICLPANFRWNILFPMWAFKTTWQWWKTSSYAYKYKLFTDIEHKLNQSSWKNMKETRSRDIFPEIFIVNKYGSVKGKYIECVRNILDLRKLNSLELMIMSASVFTQQTNVKKLRKYYPVSHCIYCKKCVVC